MVAKEHIVREERTVTGRGEENDEACSLLAEVIKRK
jgi:hypothetical protein